ncbi:MAG TPA: hypothetical protein VFC28_06865, partial [Opitutaceae bacterium]|nr:hypothetical protein [Opitutaceae bacterium]
MAFQPPRDIRQLPQLFINQSRIGKGENNMAIIDFGGVKEEVVTRDEFPMAKARKVLKNEVIAVIGYGV